MVAKIADLGLGKALGHGQSSFMSARAGGTQCWQAPEQIQPPKGACYSGSPFLLLSMSSLAPAAITPDALLQAKALQTLPCPTRYPVQTLHCLSEPSLLPCCADGKYHRRLDVFLLGCLLHLCFTGGQHPFGPDMYQQMSNIVQGRPDLAALDHLPVHQALVARMLATVLGPLAVAMSLCCSRVAFACVTDNCESPVYYSAFAGAGGEAQDDGSAAAPVVVEGAGAAELFVSPEPVPEGKAAPCREAQLSGINS